MVNYTFAALQSLFPHYYSDLLHNPSHSVEALEVEAAVASATSVISLAAAVISLTVVVISSAVDEISLAMTKTELVTAEMVQAMTLETEISQVMSVPVLMALIMAVLDLVVAAMEFLMTPAQAAIDIY